MACVLWFSTTAIPLRFKSNQILSLAEDRAGSLWLGAVGGGLTRYSDGRFRLYSTRDGLSSDFVRCLLADRAGNLWIGTRGGGLNLFRNERFTAYTTRDGLPSDQVLTLAEDGNGTHALGSRRRISPGEDHRSEWRRYRGAQTLLLNIVGITGVAPTSGTTCNGNYTGTFNGSITVSAGQNCAFYFGGVTGSVSVLGGSFATTGASIAGNVSIQGATGFSIGDGTKIAGNLTIQNAASASTTNQICGTTVSGNVNVSANAVPITIGSTGISCLGNSFGANVGITSNTAPIQVTRTTSRRTSRARAIRRSREADLAQKKTGQCAGF